MYSCIMYLELYKIIVAWIRFVNLYVDQFTVKRTHDIPNSIIICV